MAIPIFIKFRKLSPKSRRVGFVILLTMAVGAGAVYKVLFDVDKKLPFLQRNLKTELGFYPPSRSKQSKERAFSRVRSMEGRRDSRNAQDVLDLPPSAPLNDLRYRTLNRYEQIRGSGPPSSGTTLILQEASENETPAPRMKPMTLAGRGFEILSFEEFAQGRIRVDDVRFLAPKFPDPPPRPEPEHLDPMDEYLKSQRPLIFHSRATGFSKEPSVDKYLFSKHPEPGPPFAPPPVAESRLVMNRNHRTTLVLLPGEEKMDLLNGNEKLNWRDYPGD